MSMNLIFDVKGGAGCVDFPFQTPTTLTKAVLRAEGQEAKLKLIREELEGRGCIPEDIVSVLEEVKALMDNPNLELSEI